VTTFEITIQRQAGDAWPVVVELSKPGTFLPIRSEDTLQLDQDKKAELLSLEHDPLAYGTLLGQALFSGKAEAHMEGRLRVRLRRESCQRLRRRL